MRLTVVVDPASPHPAEHQVEAGEAGVLVGSAHDADVVVSGLSPHHARLRVADAQLTVHALAPGVRVVDAMTRALQASAPEAPLRGRLLDMHEARPLLVGDVVRLAPPDGAARELRVDVGLLALGGRRAVVRGLPMVAFLFVVLSGVALRRGLPAVVSLAAFAVVVTSTIAAATLVELWVARTGATRRARLVGAALTAALVTLGMTGAVVNLEHAQAVADVGLRAAGAGAVDALVLCGTWPVAQRLLALGLAAALVLDARWWARPIDAPTFMALLAGPVAWGAALVVVNLADLPGRGLGPAGPRHDGGYSFMSLAIACVFAFGLRDVQRRWPVGGG